MTDFLCYKGVDLEVGIVNGRRYLLRPDLAKALGYEKSKGFAASSIRIFNSVRREEKAKITTARAGRHRPGGDYHQTQGWNVDGLTAKGAAWVIRGSKNNDAINLFFWICSLIEYGFDSPVDELNRNDLYERLSLLGFKGSFGGLEL